MSPLINAMQLEVFDPLKGNDNKLQFIASLKSDVRLQFLHIMKEQRMKGYTATSNRPAKKW